ncbi:MAG TPA: transposase, partial [Lautropia sp.]|nr:transposase [Lautropia sp.]
GLIGSLIRLLGLDLAVPDHTTLSRRAATLEVPQPQSGSSSEAGNGAEPLCCTDRGSERSDPNPN